MRVKVVCFENSLITNNILKETGSDGDRSWLPADALSSSEGLEQQ